MMTQSSGDLPKEWRAELQQMKGFPGELLVGSEYRGTEIEEQIVRKELRGIALEWTFIIAVVMTVLLLGIILGRHPSIHSLWKNILGVVRGISSGIFFSGLGLGTVISLWAVARHRYTDLGDPIVRALDLIWCELQENSVEAPHGGEADALRSALRSLLRYKLQDECILICTGFVEARFVQSWIHDEKSKREHSDSPTENE
jgi:hypothetical protein